MNKNIKIAKQLIKLAKQLVSYHTEYSDGDQLFFHEPDLEKLCNMIINDELKENEKQEAIQKIIDDGDYFLLQDLIKNNKVNPEQKKKIILFFIGQVSKDNESACNSLLIRLLNYDLSKDQEITVLNALVDNYFINKFDYNELNYSFNSEQMKIILNRALYNYNYDLLEYMMIHCISNKEDRKMIILTLMEQENMNSLNYLIKSNKLTNEQKLFIQKEKYE